MDSHVCKYGFISSFSFFIFVARTSSTMSNGSEENSHVRLFPILREDIHFCVEYDVSCRFFTDVFSDAFYHIEVIPLYF